jgi:hypothetical protein
MSNTYTLAECVAAFNRRCPVPRNRRTVQRFLTAHNITGFGSSRHNWFFPREAVDSAIEQAFASDASAATATAKTGEGARTTKRTVRRALRKAGR